MSEQKSQQNVSSLSVDAVAHTAASPSTIQPRQRMAQHYSLIWVDGTIDTSEESWQKKISLVQSVINDVNIFTKPDECIQFLHHINSEKFFLITSGYLGQRLVPEIHSMPQLDAIYIFCGSEGRHKVWITEWLKVRGVFTIIEHMCESLKKVARQYDHDAIPMSFISKQTTAAVTSGEQNLDQLEPSYMYSLLFKDIILEVDEDDEKSIQDLLIYCRQQQIPEYELNCFQCEYRQRSPIWMYSKESFLYHMLNKALRTLDIECMIKLGFFIRNLHWQLNQLNYEQSDDYLTLFTVYRGQQLSQKAFQHLLDTKGGLLAFNNFLSTSKEQNAAREFVEETLQNHENNNVGILFIMTVDPSKLSASTTPFALIGDYSVFPQENEILFSMHAVFRVNEINQSLENNRLWEVHLTLTDDDDPELAALTDRMREETQGSTGWYRMGKLMIKLGHFNQAEELYNELLNNASKDDERAYVYHHLGWVKRNQGEYKEAISFYEKSLVIKQKALQPDDPKLAATYNNIGGVYNSMGVYSKALEYYEKTLDIDKKTLPSNHPSLADSCNNIGLVYHNMGDNSKALEFYQKAHQIKEEVLPLNHPDLATSYSNIAGVYSSMNDYMKALEFYEQALKIREKVLLEDHPDLANSYSCIGQVYQNMSNYSKALELNEKVLLIFQKTYASNHPNLATSYKSIGSVYEDMGDYLKALELYEKAREIYETGLAENHPDLASCYSCIGQVHNNLGDYSKAFQFYNKALEIRKKVLSPNHSDMAISYNNIGRVYNDMGDYSAALNALRNACQIEQEAFQEGNQGFATTYNRFGRVYRNMKDYSKALDYFEKCLAIDQKTLPEGHPYQAITYSDIGDVHRLMGDYEKACSFHLKALNIQENIRCDPSECATTYTNLGETYREMKDYSTALSYFQKGLQIREEKLPKNHPDLAVIYHNLAKLYFSTRKYSIAMKYVQQAIDIAQEKLPSNHSDLLEYRRTLEEIRKTDVK